jgi:biofilm PGA synthesis protein PgaD
MSAAAPPIIERADLQSLRQRTVAGVLTVFFWALWGYLWLPLLALIAWAVGVQQAYKYMIVLDGYVEVLKLLAIYALIIALLGGSLVAWATYNIVRYGGPEQRTARPAASVEEVARYFRQGPLAVAGWQQAQRLLVTHDADGGIAKVERDDQKVPE